MLRDYELEVEAFKEYKLMVKGDFYHILQATSFINIRFDESTWVKRKGGYSGEIEYSEVTISSSADQKIIICLGHGKLYAPDDARYALTSASGGFDVAPDEYRFIVVPDENRSSVTIMSEPNSPTLHVNTPTGEDLNNANFVWGSEARLQLATTGIWLQGGVAMTVNSQHAVAVYNPSSSTVRVGYIAT